MEIDLSSGELCLQNGRPVRLANAAGSWIHCVHGIMWITLPGQANDIFLTAGERYQIRGNGLALVESIGDGRIRLEIRSSHGAMRRFVSWVRRIAQRDQAIPQGMLFSRTARVASEPGFPA